jgi:hypothetical protein
MREDPELFAEVSDLVRVILRREFAEGLLDVLVRRARRDPQNVVR